MVLFSQMLLNINFPLVFDLLFYTFVAVISPSTLYAHLDFDGFLITPFFEIY